MTKPLRQIHIQSELTNASRVGSIKSRDPNLLWYQGEPVEIVVAVRRESLPRPIAETDVCRIEAWQGDDLASLFLDDPGTVENALGGLLKIPLSPARAGAPPGVYRVQVKVSDSKGDPLGVALAANLMILPSPDATEADYLGPYANLDYSNVESYSNVATHGPYLFAGAGQSSEINEKGQKVVTIPGGGGAWGGITGTLSDQTDLQTALDGKNEIRNYRGTWNPKTNTPTLADGTGAEGDWRRVVFLVAGETFARDTGDGAKTYESDRAVIYRDGKWVPADLTMFDRAWPSTDGGVETWPATTTPAQQLAGYRSRSIAALGIANGFPTESGHLLVIRTGAAYVTQIWQDRTSGGPNRVWWRSGNETGTGWHAWTRLALFNGTVGASLPVGTNANGEVVTLSAADFRTLIGALAAASNLSDVANALTSLENLLSGLPPDVTPVAGDHLLMLRGSDARKSLNLSSTVAALIAAQDSGEARANLDAAQRGSISAVTVDQNRTIAPTRPHEVHNLTLSGGSYTVTLSDFPSATQAARLIIRTIQDSTARTITWAGNVAFTGGVIPGLSATSGAVDQFAFEWTGTRWEAASVTFDQRSL